jgi:hypothetical protein
MADIPDEVFEQALLKYLAGSCVAEKVIQHAREQLIWGAGPRLVDRILIPFETNRSLYMPRNKAEWEHYKALLSAGNAVYEEGDKLTHARSIVVTFEEPVNPTLLLVGMHARTSTGIATKDTYSFAIRNGQRRSLEFAQGYPNQYVHMPTVVPKLAELCNQAMKNENAGHLRIVDYMGSHYGSPEKPIQLGPVPEQ